MRSGAKQCEAVRSEAVRIGASKGNLVGWKSVYTTCIHVYLTIAQYNISLVGCNDKYTLNQSTILHYQLYTRTRATTEEKGWMLSACAIFVCFLHVRSSCVFFVCSLHVLSRLSPARQVRGPQAPSQTRPICGLPQSSSPIAPGRGRRC